jgi:hypothetical protein
MSHNISPTDLTDTLKWRRLMQPLEDGPPIRRQASQLEEVGSLQPEALSCVTAWCSLHGMLCNGDDDDDDNMDA